MTQFKREVSEWHPLSVSVGSSQIFIIGDVHGQADVLEAVLAQISHTPRCCRVRQLVFLGDIIDRGPSSLKAIRLVLDARAVANVDNVVFLPGNHELMLADGIASPMEYLPDWLDNGGDQVLEEAFPGHSARRLEELGRMAEDAVGQNFLRVIATSHSYHQQGDVVFVHGGLDPSQPVEAFLAKPKFGAGLGEHWAWIREPFLDWTGGWRSPTGKPCIVVHGHTPVTDAPIQLSEFTRRADKLETHNRLCLDAGAAAVPQVAWAEMFERSYRVNLTSGEVTKR